LWARRRETPTARRKRMRKRIIEQIGIVNNK
jgi:hypothetical protein